MTDFDELFERGELGATEEARLRRVHDLLVQAGPPPELPPSLLRPPGDRPRGELAVLGRTTGRRVRAYALLAAAVAAACFGGGYLLGHSKSTGGFEATRTVPMHGPAGARGTIRIAREDSVGNWPMLVSVTGLPEQAGRNAYYELWLTRNGKPVAPCGAFRVHGKATTVRLSVPYRLHGFDGWVVTASVQGGPEPGRVVMTT